MCNRLVEVERKNVDRNWRALVDSNHRPTA
jgi:hypothetical protein